MLSNLTENQTRYGKIYPLRWGYYSNPQYFMFSFTLLLTVVLSIVMILFVFLGIYHKIIGSLLCIYVIYRFLSLGLSNPGLAIQSYTEHLQEKRKPIYNEIISNDSFQEQQTHREIHNDDHMQQMSVRPAAQTYVGQNFYSFCEKCKVPVMKSTKHCNICKCCVNGFDHHCIWIGKCIGEKNMWEFKQFLCFVFLTLIYGLILSIQMSKVEKISK